MNIQDLAFTSELEALRKAYLLKIKKVGITLAKIDAKIKLRYLCERYGKKLEDYWHD